MTIYEYHGSIFEHAALNIFKWIPHWKMGCVIWVISALFLLIRFFKLRESKVSSSFDFGILSLMWIGVFIASYQVIDEVSLNLEHPYNLFHFGRFSMSPEKMVDGTVEHLFYLLHTPFAYSLESLFLGNFLISLLVGWLHLFYIWKTWFKNDPVRDPLLLGCFVLALPLVRVWSTGFGNGLLSLAFLFSVGSMTKQQVSKSLWISGLLPLIRPEGLILSMVNIMHWLLNKQYKKSVKQFFIALSIPAGSLFLYLFIHHAMYGYWIPTPILFKSIKLSMLPMIHFGDLKNDISRWAKEPVNVAFSVILFSLFTFKRKWSFFSDIQRSSFLYLILLMPVMAFFVMSVNTMGFFGGDTHFRYWICTTMMLCLCALLWVRDSENIMGKEALRSCGYILFVLFFILGIAQMKNIRKVESFGLANRNYLAVAGRFMERIFPANFKFATTEMSTFGLGARREVLDLWGYSNRNIATSSVCNGMRVRNNPHIFLEAKPEVYFPFWFSDSKMKGWEYFYLNSYANIEDGLRHMHVTRSHGNMLGDMNQAIELYNLWLFVDPKEAFQVAALVRKDKNEQMENSLTESGFMLNRSRLLNSENFKKYNEQPLVQYPC